MAETIKGGAYQSADGSWHDANGKPLSSKQVQEAEAFKKAQEFELEQAEIPASETLLPGRGINPEGREEEPPIPVAESKRKTRKS
jgi:hypothetical protein